MIETHFPSKTDAKQITRKMRLIEQFVTRPSNFISRVKNSKELRDMHVTNIHIELKKFRYTRTYLDFQAIATALNPTSLSVRDIIGRLCASGKGTLYHYIVSGGANDIQPENFKTGIDYAKYMWT